VYDTGRKDVMIRGKGGLVMKKFAVAVLLLATGCATTTVAPKRAEIEKLKDAEVRAVTFAPAPFVLASAGKAAAGGLFGMIGGAVAGASMQRAGEEMIDTYAVPDPAIAVRERLAGALTDEFGLRLTTDTAPAGDTAAELKAKFGDATVLDTQTIGWQLVYYGSDWTHHYLVYAGRGRLLRLSDRKVLWEDRCFIRLPDPKGSRRKVDDYRANNGELLKQKAQEAADACANELIAHLRGR
jgi:hypothetical protein